MHTYYPVESWVAPSRERNEFVKAADNIELKVLAHSTLKSLPSPDDEFGGQGIRGGDDEEEDESGGWGSTAPERWILREETSVVITV